MQKSSKDAKFTYVQSVQAKVERKRLGSRDFWKLSNQILNWSKASIPIILNGPEAISFSLDKVNLFAKIFVPKSMLDDKDNPHPDFSRLTKHNRSNIYFTEKSQDLSNVLSLSRLLAKIKS